MTFVKLSQIMFDTVNLKHFVLTKYLSKEIKQNLNKEIKRNIEFCKSTNNYSFVVIGKRE